MTNNYNKHETLNVVHYKDKTLISQFKTPKIEKIFAYILLGDYDYVVTEFGNIYKKISNGFEIVANQKLIELAHEHIKNISGHKFVKTDIFNKKAILAQYGDEQYLQDPTIQEIVGSIGFDGHVCHITNKSDVFVDYLEDMDSVYDKVEPVMDIRRKQEILNMYKNKIASAETNERNV